MEFLEGLDNNWVIVEDRDLFITVCSILESTSLNSSSTVNFVLCHL